VARVGPSLRSRYQTSILAQFRHHETHLVRRALDAAPVQLLTFCKAMPSDLRGALWQLIQTQLTTGVPDWRGRIEHYQQVSAVAARETGRQLDDKEIFEALVRSVLSNSTDWAKVERVLPQLTELFRGFDASWYESLPVAEIESEVLAWFLDRRAGSMTLGQDLRRLRQSASRLVARGKEHGSMWGYIEHIAEGAGGDPKAVALTLARNGGPNKLPGVGVALAAEFLKNLGFDISKPDRHILRSVGSFGLVEFRRWSDSFGTGAPQASKAELLQTMSVMEEWAGAVCVPVTYLDNAVWILCAKSGLYLNNSALRRLASSAADTNYRITLSSGPPGITSKYADRLREHLSRYKVERLGVPDHGTWAQNGREYEHILPQQLFQLNILEPIRREFWQHAKSSGLQAKLHRDFHHLSSSQAFAFNLFFPFFGLPEQSAEPLLQLLRLPVEPIRHWAFEHQPSRREGTNFDFYIEFEAGWRVYFEVKLTESQFGSCASDEHHRQRYQALYREMLEPKLVAAALAETAFFANYQLGRNVGYADERSTVIFLIPRSNRAIFEQAQSFLDHSVRPEVRNGIHVIDSERVFADLTDKKLHPFLEMHTAQMREKYVPGWL
jgi:hypothetical protein